MGSFLPAATPDSWRTVLMGLPPFGGCTVVQVCSTEHIIW
jgi:hypothetical protein